MGFSGRPGIYPWEGPGRLFRPTNLEDPLRLRPDAILALAVGAPVQRLDNGPPLAATVGAFGP